MRSVIASSLSAPHDLASLTIALDHLMALSHDRKRIVVLSDILESGEEPKRLYSAVAGLVVRQNMEELNVRARRGVILCAGGFVMNPDMVAEHTPALSEPTATPLRDPLRMRS